jgi:hypothetical protein
MFDFLVPVNDSDAQVSESNLKMAEDMIQVNEKESFVLMKFLICPALRHSP